MLHLRPIEVRGLILCFLISCVFLKALLNLGQSRDSAPSLCPATQAWREDGGVLKVLQEYRHSRKW